MKLRSKAIFATSDDYDKNLVEVDVNLNKFIEENKIRPDQFVAMSPLVGATSGRAILFLYKTKD
jgi:hypothetical protein